MNERLSYSIPDAAEAVGYSETVLKGEIAKGTIVPRYANRKPVIPATELLDWLESLPTEAPRKSA